MATVTVDQQKLVLNAFAAQFQNNLITGELCEWRKHDNELNDRNGLNYSEQVGPRYVVTETTNGVKDLSAGVQDSVFGSEQFNVNKTFGASMGWGDFVKIRDIGDARNSEAVANAALNLAEKIDAYIMGVCSTAFNNWLGTPANSIADFDDVASGYTRLKEEGVLDANLRAVLTYGDKQALGAAVITDAIDSLSGDVYRNGWDGRVAGIPTTFTQQLTTLTTGTRTNGAVNGAAQNVNYSAVAVSGAPGRYKSQTIAADGFGANATIKKGEVFTIANVQAWDNRLGASLGRLQQFTVLEDATADGAGAVAALRIYPAIIVQGTNDVNTAHATVNAAPADNAVITWVGSASTAYKPRFIMEKSAIRVNTADLIMPATGTAMRKALSKIPLSVRMWQDSDFATGDHSVRFDVALTANVVDRVRGVRINGS